MRMIERIVLHASAVLFVAGVSAAARTRIAHLALVAVLCVLLFPGTAQTQAPQVARVGVLAGGGAGFEAGFQPFQQRLRELGYVDDRTIVLEVRNAQGRSEHYRKFAAELVRLDLDVIVVQGNVALAALKQATRSIPIVMANIGDPVRSGFIASLARPGGNITGLSNMGEGISAKWLELLVAVAPSATRVAVLRDPRSGGHASMWSEIEGASRALKVTTVAWDAREPTEIERAFSAMRGEGIGAVIILPHPPASANKGQIARLATAHRLPAIALGRELADAGVLMSYGPSVADLWRRSADVVDKILKGAKPQDLPVDQPTKFELVVNLRTAKALGLALPPSLLLQADSLIQ